MPNIVTISHITISLNMGTHMKTTVEINDSLMTQVRDLASQRQQTFKSILETALRQFIEANEAHPQTFHLRKGSFQGQGLQTSINQDNWEEIRAYIYEGQGG
jgi:hypothetical protein